VTSILSYSIAFRAPLPGGDGNDNPFARWAVTRLQVVLGGALVFIRSRGVCHHYGLRCSRKVTRFWLTACLTETSRSTMAGALFLMRNAFGSFDLPERQVATLQLGFNIGRDLIIS